MLMTTLCIGEAVRDVGLMLDMSLPFRVTS
jgi:hypothetical protein